MNRILSRLLPLALILTIVATPVSAQTFHRKSKSQPKQKIELVKSPSGITEEIIEHTGFTVSYNPNLLIPNWVCYELTPSEASATDVSRTDDFRPDPQVSVSAEDTDYRGSKYDRGHMAPAADMKWSEKAMSESFYFSNICPQNRELNAGRWCELEKKIRWWVKKYKTPAYICCGPVFVSDHARYIGKNEVVVPDAFFKTVLQQRDGKWVCAGFLMPNVPLDEEIEDLGVPLAVIEIITEYLFYSNQPEIQNIKLSYNKEDWKIAGWKNN